MFTFRYIGAGLGHPVVTVAIDYDDFLDDYIMSFAVRSKKDAFSKSAGRMVASRRMAENDYIRVPRLRGMPLVEHAWWGVLGTLENTDLPSDKRALLRKVAAVMMAQRAYRHAFGTPRVLGRGA